MRQAIERGHRRGADSAREARAKQLTDAPLIVHVHSTEFDRSGGGHGNPIAREIEFLIEDLAIDLCKLETFKHIKEAKDLQVLSTILINMSFTWAMTWINLPKQFTIDHLLEQQNLFIDNAATQVRLLFRGISNWEPQNA